MMMYSLPAKGVHMAMLTPWFTHVAAETLADY
jgi:hypothetical protein